MKLKALLLAALLPFTVQADVVRVAVGLALPPYVIADEDRGAELDIVRESLALRGYKTEAVYVPFRKFLPMVVDGEVDGALTLSEDSGADSLFYSDSHITYQNMVIGLRDRNLTVESMDDLEKYWVLGFHDAKKYLGPEFAAMAESNSRYSETSRQKSQVSMLFKERVDLVVSDKNIFNWYRRQINRPEYSRPVSYFPLFTPNHYKVGFNKEALRDEFNLGLKQLKESGRYNQILEYYFREF